MNLSNDQENAIKQIRSFLKSGDKFTSLGGYAGTGKTTVISALKDCGISMTVVAPTGKAAEVLKLKGFDDAKTIHSYMYRPEKNKDGKLYFVKRNGSGSKNLLVVDESSMVGEKMFKDLIDFHQGKILWVGDHGQLKPVKSKFSIMESPVVRLETIQRQAENNPIVRASMIARTGGKFESSDYSDETGFTLNDTDVISKIFKESANDCFLDLQMITRTNESRHLMNEKSREAMGIKGPPIVGDKIIFLQNCETVRNGTIEYIEDIGKNFVVCNGEMIKSKFDPTGAYCKEMTAYDFGYAVTCHKSQGSEFPHVIIKVTVKDLAQMGKESKNWLYTAITRAKKSCHLLIRK